MKRSSIAMMGTVVLLLAGRARAQDPALVLHYRFDDGSGSIATDSSKSKNHGAITGATWTTNGRSNGALLFDGDGDYVRSSTYPFDPATTNFSASVWFKPLHKVDWYWGIVAQRDKNGPGRFWLNTSQWAHIRTKIGNGDVRARIEGTTPLLKDVWYHAVVTYADRDIRVYLDAKLEASRSGVDQAESTVGDMVIGAIKYMDRLFFHGIIDDVQIYRRLLTPGEVAFLFENPGRVIGKPASRDAGPSDARPNDAGPIRDAARDASRIPDTGHGDSSDSAPGDSVVHGDSGGFSKDGSSTMDAVQRDTDGSIYPTPDGRSRTRPADDRRYTLNGSSGCSLGSTGRATAGLWLLLVLLCLGLGKKHRRPA